ncbi:UV-endonuclease UvdE-domain-containing protein [Elsinoe ampelina]|uniref:UV-endonuclease UvdE-domain-containing protein n=1 Tax=Elsinoe ampelina TaxID=302913 RepID=A0A6A6GRJ8_9PEZI|nr:UV-endonuclease UvdE-domain-containing protein [Elsinoe ampelina]
MIRLPLRLFSRQLLASSRIYSSPAPSLLHNMAPKRKRSSVATDDASTTAMPPPVVDASGLPTPDNNKRKSRKVDTAASPAMKAPPSPPVLTNGLHAVAPEAPIVKTEEPESPLSEPPELEAPPQSKSKGKRSTKAKAAPDDDKAPKMPIKTEEDVDALRDNEAEVDEEADEEEVKEALSRPPPVNSSYLPLPWKGRLGYACLNTYLRYSTPPVFSSRTCRIASILEHRHPLQNPNEPEHATKNRPDRMQPADEARGKRYLEEICLANVRDISKMVRWNDKYGIKFMRLSSEMFPFASHEEYGYPLAPFAADALAEAGRVIAELGHRVTTHPGQFTQLGSPRESVTANAIRDLAYHDEMLSLLKLPEQQNRDAVMILHLGGVFGDKAATLDRFRSVYATLPQSIKNRLVLENDDVSWCVHELLPICEELNIPFVLDYHHHNIIFDSTQIREGTADIVNLYPRILATWQRKNITPKMHYSEPTPPAITGRQRRKHSARVMTLPPCPDTMDLMIEAKDKEQACFELMRTFKLPGYETFNDIIPYTRADDNKFAVQEQTKRDKKLATKKAKAAKKGEDVEEEELEEIKMAPDEEVGMGGPEGRVYWPPTMEEWLRPKKREVKPKNPAGTPAKKVKAEDAGEEAEDSDPGATPATKKAKAALKAKFKAAQDKVAAATKEKLEKSNKGKTETAPKPKAKSGKKKKEVITPSTSDGEEPDMPELSEQEEPPTPVIKKQRPAPKGRRQSGRAKKGVTYDEDEMDVDLE